MPRLIEALFIIGCIVCVVGSLWVGGAILVASFLLYLRFPSRY